jgi:hypothetical protein
MVKLLKADQDVKPGDNRVAVNSDEIIAAIRRDGYALHEADVTTTIGNAK